MNSFVITFCCLAVASTSGGVLHHTSSGIVGVSADGALVAGPAGSIHTTNGLHGHGAAVQVSGPSGDLHTHSGEVLIHAPGYLDNTWGHSAEEDTLEHADEGEWHGEEDQDWSNKEEEEHKDEEGNWKKWDDEEEKKWDDNEGQWGEEHSEWHKLVKRQIGIKNGPEGRWNKEEERYIWNDNSKNNEAVNDQAYVDGPFGIPSWNHGF